jgi:hypothetical protein
VTAFWKQQQVTKVIKIFYFSTHRHFEFQFKMASQKFIVVLTIAIGYIAYFNVRLLIKNGEKCEKNKKNIRIRFIAILFFLDFILLYSQ